MTTPLYSDLVSDINNRLVDLTGAFGPPDSTLARAVSHALLAPGKRLRPIITMLLASNDPDKNRAALDAGCACEMVHAASLILDDLPAMDDAMLRRGVPCVHVAFSESVAILAATALLNQAYSVIARLPDISAEKRIELVGLMTDAIGVGGLIGGQQADLQHDEETGRQEILSRYERKTGSLFEFSVMAGAIIRGMNENERNALKTVSHHLGIAFQVHDDLLDATADITETKKDCGKDLDKTTYLASKTPDEIRQRMMNRKGDAMSALSKVPVEEAFHHLIAEQFDLAISRAR